MACIQRQRSDRPRLILAVDPGHSTGVALLVPTGREGVVSYRLKTYGLLRPNTTVAVRNLFNELLSLTGSMALPCLYVEDQYIDPGGKGEKRLRGQTMKALIENRCRWVFMAELSGTPWVPVNPQRWQTAMLGIRGRASRTARKQKAQKMVEDTFRCRATQDEADAVLIGIWAVGRESEVCNRFCQVNTEGAPGKGKRWP